MATTKALKAGQLVRVVATVKDESGKTLVSHGRSGFCLTASSPEDGSVRVQFPTRAVSLTAVDILTCVKTCKGRPRKLLPNGQLASSLVKNKKNKRKVHPLAEVVDLLNQDASVQAEVIC